MRVISLLERFYKNEERNLPQPQALLWDLGWELAEIFELADLDLDYPELFLRLIEQPNSVDIDNAVDILHRSLLPTKEQQEELFYYANGNLKDYLLHRNDAEWRRQQEEYVRKEEALQILTLD